MSEISVMKILIVKLSAIGDVIHTLPALNAIRLHYPDAHITWLVEAAAAPLIEGHTALDRVLISKRKEWVKRIFGVKSLFFQRTEALKEASAFIKELRDTRYDLIFDFQALLKSGVLIGIARGNRKIGYDKGMEHAEHSYIFLNERIQPVDMNIHAIMRSMMLLERIGIYSNEIVYKIPVQENDRKKADDLLQICRGEPPCLPFLLQPPCLPFLVAINPVAKWETKLWDNEKFAVLADRLIEEYGAKIVFTGGAEDYQSIETILSFMKGNALNLAGKTTLKILAAIYEKADLLISTDTGPMHLGAAVGTPVTAIFGPTAPWRTGPFGSNHQVIRAGLPCSPCFKRKCKTTDCMKQISVEQVLNSIKRLS